MYLKEISANGFKSFADKITIVLNDETTCIVGPNGSGKSNIVDAVRWVLGEQSVKSLRGEGAMSDVIFAGSASRKMKNAASVELVFDNRDHYLHVDYTEVSIKRRVFRSGENEYFMNHAKCRLKDIVNLFLDSGVGRESFNIIGQGEVQRILSEGKDERRLIFEEAAGILKYKKRKEEALRKLDRTHDSLDRVEDIIHELEVQVTPLKEQSERAKEYLENKKNLEMLEVALLAYDIYNLNSEEDLLKKELQTLEGEITTLSNTVTIASSEKLKEKNYLAQLEKDLAFTQSELLRKTEDVLKLNGELQVLKVERKKRKGNTSEEDALFYHTKRAELKRKISLAEDKIEGFFQQLNEKEESLSVLKSQISTLKLKKKTEQQEYSKIDRDLLSYKHKIELLQIEMEKNSTLPQAVRSVLNEKNLNGIYDTIGNVMKVEPTYLKALDVASSSSKNFIIVKDESCAKKAILYLKNNHLGRATFFPLTVIEPRELDRTSASCLRDVEGYLGVLADQIETDPRYKNIIKNQFGLVLLAKDMDSALYISEKTKRRYKVITLDGDVLHVGGSMTGGTLYKRRSFIMLGQEITSCQNTVTALQKTSKKIVTNLTTLEEKIRDVEDEYYNLVKTVERLKEDKKIEEDALKQQKESLEDTTKAIDRLESDTVSLDQKEKQLIDQFYKESSFKEKLEHKGNTLGEKVKEWKRKIEQMEMDNKYENNLLRKKEEEKKELEIRLSRLDVKLDTMLNTLASDYSMTYEKARGEYPLEIEEEKARREVENYKANIRRLGMVNLAAIEEYERISTRYNFILHQKEDLLKAEATLLEIMDEMDSVMKKEFLETFERIKEEFQGVFREMFRGGSASLKLTDSSDLLTTGIDIIASPPGKKLSTIQLLSGGEKTLTAISLLFAILNVRKVPFCIFDEVEAALDEANVDQFGSYLEHYKKKTQFLIITHKKKTMEYADTLYGITMQESGVSKLVSVKLTNKEELI